MSAEKRILIVFCFIFTVVCIGTAGYYVIEGWPLLDSFYMTMITITTVGYKEVYPLSSAGKLFTVLMLVLGVSAMFFALGTIVEYFLELRFAELLRRRRMERNLQKLKNHHVICGYGRIGKEVSREFVKRGVAFVVIENAEEELKQLESGEMLFISGDAADEEILLKAGVKNAKGLVCATSSDADNVFIALTARGLNSELYIAARCIHSHAEPKLRQAGADMVISPYVAGGKRLAMALLKPNALEFLEGVMHGEGLEMGVEEIHVKEGAPFMNKSIRDSHIHHETGVLIIGVKKKDGKFISNPPADALLQEGDRLIIIGKNADLSRFEKTFVNDV